MIRAALALGALAAPAAALSWLELPRPRGWDAVTAADLAGAPYCVDSSGTYDERGVNECDVAGADCRCGRAALATALDRTGASWEDSACAFARDDSHYGAEVRRARVEAGGDLCVAWAAAGHESDADRDADHGYGGGVRVALSPLAAPSMADMDAGVIARLDFEDYAGAEVRIPESVAAGLYTLQFLWQTADGSVWANCADVVVTAAGDSSAYDDGGVPDGYYPGGSCGDDLAAGAADDPAPSLAAGEADPGVEAAVTCRTSADARGTYSVVGRRPRGLHWDVEPHGLDAWSSSRETLSGLYLNLLQLIDTACMADAAAELRYTVDTQMHYDDASVNELTVDGETATLFDFVAQRVDAVMVMSYRDFALGDNSVTANAEGEMANAEGVDIIVGLETMDTGEDVVDFAGENSTVLESVFADVFAYFDGEANFDGISVHDYTHYSVFEPLYTLAHATDTRRGLFLWDTTVTYTSSLRDAMLEFVDNHAIAVVYIESEYLLEAYPRQLAALINALALRRVEVELLFGRAEWVYSSGQVDALDACDNAVAFVDDLARLADECEDGEVQGEYAADSDDSSLALIAGAGVGALALVGGLVYARRRYNEREHQTTKVYTFTTTTDGGGAGGGAPPAPAVSVAGAPAPAQAATPPGGVSPEQEALAANMQQVLAARGRATPKRKTGRRVTGGKASPALPSRRRGGIE